MRQALESVVAQAREALGSRGNVIGPDAAEAPRFELFHAANSICSQKVRTVLAYHGVPYANHSLNLFKGDTYQPAYVRLRMIGCEELGGALVSHHSGSTSASAGGCDGAVVPTLVDRQTASVVVDSKRICLYLDELAAEGRKLRPASLAEAIDEELAIVDNMPNYQMLMGRSPAASEGDQTKGNTGGKFSQMKVAWCDRYLRENAEDPSLVAAYTAKRAKELSAANELFSPEAMAAAHDCAQAALRDLEGKLARSARPWLYGATPSMADLFWAIQLLRMKNIGEATSWEAGRLPHVANFLVASEGLSAIRAAIIEWPSALF